MPTALTGSLGWTGLHPFQLGGPPLIHSWTRPLADHALPLLAHAFQNDGVTPLSANATFKVLNRPSIHVMTANGGPDQITLEVDTGQQGSTLWGGFTWGGAVWGGSGLGLTQGNVIRLTEVGGPWPGYVYTGVIEGFPDTRSSTGTKHGILLTPYAAELTRVATQLLYTSPVDVAQTVRDAIVLTQHCHCDQCSVPIATGVMIATDGQVDYRGQKVNQVLDTARSILGPTWYWHCDEGGRVWLQPQGSAANYTLMGGAHYQERESNGGEITDRINQVPVVGGLDPANPSQNVTLTVNGSSQSTIGVRTLDPPLQIPGITARVTLNKIAQGVLGTLDQTWTRVRLTTLPAKFPQRIHMSQPGGAVVRVWEPGLNPMTETGAAAGYIGPFILQGLTYDGLTQQIEAGNIPVTNQADVANLVKSLLSRLALNSANVTWASLNTPGQVMTGDVKIVDQSSGLLRVSLGSATGSAQPFALHDVSGNLIADSVGLVAVMSQLGQVQGVPSGVETINSVSFVLLDDGNGHQATITFTLARQARVKVEASVSAYVSTSSIAGSGNSTITAYVDGVDQQSTGLLNAITFQSPGPGPNTGVAYTAPLFWSEPLSAGSHTIKLMGNTQDLNTSLNILGWSFWVFLLGT